MKRIQRGVIAAIAILAASAPTMAFAQQRSLFDFLAPGQQVTLPGEGSTLGDYLVQVWHPAIKASTQETRELLAHALQRDSNNNQSRARASMEAAMRRGADGAREFAAARSRAGFGSYSRPTVEPITFYEVGEIGKDYVALKVGKITRYIALSKIREVQIEALDDETAKRQAESQIANTHVSVFSRMLAAYAADVGQLPTQSQGLQALLRAPMDLEDASGWRGPYFARSSIPDDPWGQPYTWVVKEEGSQVEVRTSGVDGKPNTDDDITAIAPVIFVSSEGAGVEFGGAAFRGVPAFAPPPGAEAPARELTPAAPRAVEPAPVRPPMER